jgi:hypothetical protein
MIKVFLSLLTLISLSAFAATSEEERSTKKFELTLQSGGDYRMSTNQIAAMYFLHPNDLIGLKLGEGQGNSRKESQTNIAAQYKHYFSNSFYAAGEIFYLNSREDVNGFFGDIFNLRDYDNYSSMGAGIRIGNQWTWNHFTLGCDWVGIGQRVGTFRKDTSRLNNSTFTFLNVIIGTNF